MERQKLKQQQQLGQPVATNTVNPSDEVPVLDSAVNPIRTAGAPPSTSLISLKHIEER